MDSKEKEVLDKLIKGFTTFNISLLYEIAEMKLIDDDENYTKLFSTLGKTIDSIDGGIDYILERYKEIGETCQNLIYPISYTRSYDRIQEMIENPEQYHLYWDNDYIAILYAGLARSSEHKHLAEELLMDPERLNTFSSEGIVNIVCAFKDCELVEKFLNNKELVDLDVWSHEQEATSDKVIFDASETKRMIISTENKEYIKKYATDEKLKLKMGYTEDDIALLAIKTEDEALIRSFIDKREKLQKSTILKLILAIKDPEMMLDAMKYPVGYKLEDGDICQIAYEGKFSKETLEEMPTFAWSYQGELALELLTGGDPFSKIHLEDVDAEIDLPESMTVGIEIESLGNYTEAIRIRGNIGDWKAKEDSTIYDANGECGIEVVSPVLTGDTNKTSQKIKQTTGLLQSIGQYANSSCGAHVHIGADYLTSKQAFNNLKELWANNEKIFFTISNKEGELPRPGVEDFARQVSREFEEQLPDSIQIDNKEDLNNFKKRLAQKQLTRYSAINFKNLGKGGKGTIEFRLSNGTVDAKTWIENINLYGGLVRAAQEISLIQEKSPDERTDDEKEKLAIFDILGTDESLQEEERLEYLLKLIISDPKKRETYRKRYRINSELILKNPTIEKRVNNNLSEKLIRYPTKKEIGKEVFTGKNAVNGEQMEEISSEISQGMEMLNIKENIKEK